MVQVCDDGLGETMDSISNQTHVNDHGKTNDYILFGMERYCMWFLMVRN